MPPGRTATQTVGMASLLRPDPVVMGHEVLDLVAVHGGRCPLPTLREDVRAIFGPGAIFGNCHGDRFDLDGLVSFLTSVRKLAVEGDVVVLGPVAGCGGHGHEH